MTIIDQIVSFKLSGISYSGNSTQLNFTSGVTAGTCTASKSLVVDSFRSITNVNALTLTTLNATTINGLINTASQPNITALGTLTNLNISNNLTVIGHDGVDSGLILGATLVTSTAHQLNYNNITAPGTAQASKTLVLDSSSNITGINTITTNALSVTTITLSGTQISATAAQLNYNAISTPGIAQSSRVLVLNSSSNISSINILSAATLTATTLNGTIATAAQPNITSIGSLTTLTMNGPITGITNLSLSGNITGASTISATNLTGTLTTAAQPNITSVGTLTNLTVSGFVTTNVLNATSLSINGTDITSSLTNLAPISGVTAGLAAASKSLIVDTNRNITNINTLTTTSLLSTNLTGTLTSSSAVQPNITSLGTLSTLAISGGITSVTNINMSGNITGASTISATSFSGTLTTVSQPNITTIGTLTNLFVTGNIGLGTTVASRKLEINSTTGTCLRLSHNAPTGSATNFTDFTVDSNGSLNISPSSGFINLASTAVIGNSSSENMLCFNGVTAHTGNNNTVISQRLYNVSNFAEMYLFNGTDIAGSNGPDRIRLRSGEIRFQIYTSTETYNTSNDNNNALIIASSGKLSVNASSSPSQQLDINNATGNCLRLIYNSTGTPSFYTDFNINTVGNLNIKSINNLVQIGDNSDSSQTLQIGTSNVSGVSGVVGIVTTTAGNYIYSGLNAITGSSSDLIFTNYGQNITTSNRKVIIKANGNVGIGTALPSTKLEINDNSGNCLKLSFNADAGVASIFCTQNINSTGLLTFNAVGPQAGFAFTGGNVFATIQTQNQPFITSIGTLANLNLVGPISGVTNLSLSGNITGASSISSTTFIGSIGTASQTNITTLGTLTNLAVAGVVQIGQAGNGSADLLCMSASTNSFVGLRIENKNATAVTSGTQISFTGYSATNNNYEIAKIAAITTNSGNAASFQFGSLAFYTRSTNLSSGASEQMRLTNSGFLGINTSTPGYYLDVNGTTRINNLLLGNSADTRSMIMLSALDNSMINGSNRFITLGQSLSTNNQFEISYNHVSNGSTLNYAQFGLYGNTFKVSLNSNGLGLGTSAPSQILEINQNSASYAVRYSNNLTSNSSAVTDVGTDSSGNYIIKSSNNSIYIGTSSDTSQNIFLGTTSTTGTSGSLKIFTSSAGNFIQSGTNTTQYSAADLIICDYGSTLSLSNRKIIFQAGGNVGFGTSAPSRQLEINSTNGNCLRLTHNASAGSATTYCDVTVSSAGVTTFNTAGSASGFVFTGGNITGTLATAAQPSITSVGTLTGLNLSGNITGVGTITMNGVLTGATSISSTVFVGTLTTAAQPNITSIGGLSTLALNGPITGGVTGITFATNTTLTLGGGSSNVTANTLTGTLTTAAQPNITSLGTLTNLSLTGTITGLSGITFSQNAAISLSGSSSSISANQITGTLQTAVQPNITSVGTLTSLALSGAITGVTGISFSNNASLNLSGSSTLSASSMTASTSVTSPLATINKLNIGGTATNVTNLSAWGTAGIIFNSATSANYVFNDTSTGTSSTNSLNTTFNSFGTPVLTATNTGVVTTTASTVYIDGAPTASTNQTITNPFALFVNSGNAYFGGNTIASSNNFKLNGSLANTALSNWSTNTAPARNYTSGCWSPELGLFAITNSTSTSTILTSPDGVTWTPRNLASTFTALTGICWSPDLMLFIAVGTGAGASNTHFTTSATGITWTSGTVPAVPGLTSVCWSADLKRLIATSTNGYIIYSSNAQSFASNTANWGAIVNPISSVTLSSSIWCRELSLFVVTNAFAGTNTAGIYTSPNGITWTGRTTPSTTDGLSSVAWSRELGYFVAVSNGRTNIMHSTDATSWTMSSFPNMVGGYRSVSWIPELGAFVAVGGSTTTNGNNYSISYNGTSWSSTSYTSTFADVRSCIVWSPDLSLMLLPSANASSTYPVITTTQTSNSTLNVVSNTINSVPSRLGMTAASQLVNSSGLNGTFKWVNATTLTQTNELMRLSKEGFLGINTETPQRLLHITAPTNGDSAKVIRLSNPSNNWLDMGINTDGSLVLNSSSISTGGTRGGLYINSTDYQASRLLSTLSPNMTSGGVAGLCFGRTATGNNQAEIFFKYNSDGSALNALTFGFHSTAALLTLNAAGHIGVQSDKKIYINGGDNSALIGFNTSNIVYIGKEGSETPINTTNFLEVAAGGTGNSANFAGRVVFQNSLSVGSNNTPTYKLDFISPGWTNMLVNLHGGNYGFGLGSNYSGHVMYMSPNSHVWYSGTSMSSPSSSGFGTERMVLNQNGNLKVNNLCLGTSTDTSRGISLLSDSYNGTFLCIGRANSDGNQAEISFTYVGPNSGDNTLNIGFYAGNNYAKQIEIYRSGNAKITGGVWQAVSDYRIKQNIEDLNYGLNEINKIRPVTYYINPNINNKNTKKNIGFIAHELQEIIPELVDGVKDAIDNNNKPIFQSVSYSQITAVLVKGMQEQININTDLENKNKELNNKIENLESKLEDMQKSIDMLLSRLQ